MSTVRVAILTATVVLETGVTLPTKPGRVQTVHIKREGGTVATLATLATLATRATRAIRATRATRANSQHCLRTTGTEDLVATTTIKDVHQHHQMVEEVAVDAGHHQWDEGHRIKHHCLWNTRTARNTEHVREVVTQHCWTAVGSFPT